MVWPDPYNQPENCIRFLFRVQYILRKKPNSGKDQLVDSTGALYTLDMEQDLVEDHLEMFMALKFARWGLPHRVRKTMYRDIANHVVLMKQDNVGCTVLPVEVSVDICTVQKESEDLDDTVSRLIKSKTFAFVRAEELPEYQPPPPPEDAEPEPAHISLLASLMKRTKVEGKDCDEDCSICLDKPRIGSEICFLPCSHCYHFKCILRWLDKSPLCPYCRGLISFNPAYPPHPPR